MSKTEPQNGSALIVIIVAVVILVIGFLGYFLWNSMSNSSKNDVQSTTRPGTKQEEKTITTKLPNGKTATYPDTDGNQEIVFRDAMNGDPQTEYVYISHKGYDEYLATLDNAKVDELCGVEGNLKALRDDYIYGMFSTTTKKITPPQNWNCVDLLASDENPDESIRATAKAELAKITSDIEAFTASVNISN